MKPDERLARLIVCLLGILPIVWLGLLIAPAVSGGLPEIIATFPTAMNQPFRIVWCGDSLKTVLIFLCCYEKAGFEEQRVKENAFPYMDELWSRCRMTAVRQVLRKRG